ncbi:conserved exported protein of unknown function [Nitrospira sp. KM1]|uniref:hypothetical protein n=1 Tax=Nitrospira sp. KM1 TaxID=1936990 RepID=UPI0013A7A3ED|nr:hypothetical protein [Nitrospira sp. KM1]BCA55017.1 conserved exported protein of unknown function [Nitrospira sp. KM1]
MLHRWIIGAMLLSGSLSVSSPIHASTGDVGTIIERFVLGQFPQSVSHYWVINETQWDGDEMIVDVNAVVSDRQEQEPTQNRYLLLIVAGELKGAQNVPLEQEAECTVEKQA